MKLFDPLLEKVKTFMSSSTSETFNSVKENSVSFKIKNSEEFVFFSLNEEANLVNLLQPYAINKAYSVRDTLNSKFTIPARDKEWTVMLNNEEAFKGTPINVFEFFKNCPNLLSEAVYEGNIGLVELVQFYKVATKEQKSHLEKLIAQKKFKEGWAYFQEVIDVSLK
jgi:hypothetical protein